MQLYIERGFEQTTVAEIAQRAGLTARTFFRYFTDKREVLFSGSAMLQEHLVRALEAAPATATPMQAVAAALDAAAELLGRDRDFSRQRQSVIDANAELRERELIKLASLAAALADALRRRGVDEPDASLAAQAGIVVLRVAFEQWIGAPHSNDRAKTNSDDRVKAHSDDRATNNSDDLSTVMRESLDRLKTVTKENDAPAPRAYR